MISEQGPMIVDGLIRLVDHLALADPSDGTEWACCLWCERPPARMNLDGPWVYIHRRECAWAMALVVVRRDLPQGHRVEI